MSEATLSTAKRRVRWGRRVFLAVIALVLLLVLGAVGVSLYRRHLATQALEAAVAEADRTDPGWRLEDLNAKRANVPPADNAAIPAMKAADMIPEDFEKPIYKLTGIVSLLPNTALDAREIDYHRQIVKPFEGAVPIARQALPLKQGWIPGLETTESAITILNLRKLASFMLYHAALCDQDGDHDNACLSGLTILAVTRAIGSVLCEAICRSFRKTAIDSLERTLAQAPESVTVKLLEQAQRDLTQEAAKPQLINVLRGERAWLHQMLIELEAGTLDENYARQYRQDMSDLRFYLETGNTYKLVHAWLLDHFNKAIAVSKLPTHEQLPKLKQLDIALLDVPPGVKIKGLVDFEGGGRSDLTTQAQLRCAFTAIAVERFRLAKGCWPNFLEDVVAAKLLDQVPLDVFDGKPLRFRKTKNGVVVYSIGPDGTYQGDALDAIQEDLPVRFEFRLWNPEERRKGPRPAPRQVDHPGD